jgi:hypothetical protein
MPILKISIKLNHKCLKTKEIKHKKVSIQGVSKSLQEVLIIDKFCHLMTNSVNEPCKPLIQAILQASGKLTIFDTTKNALKSSDKRIELTGYKGYDINERCLISAIAGIVEQTKPVRIQSGNHDIRL